MKQSEQTQSSTAGQRFTYPDSISLRGPTSRSLKAFTLLGLLMAFTISACEQSGAGSQKNTGAASGNQASPGVTAAQGTGGPAASRSIPDRWYSAEHVAKGEAVYVEHCAACHGADAEGAPDWRQRDPDGKFPPPPLNGTAHTWHHPVSALFQQMRFGAPGGIGKMPGFEGKLSGDDMAAVIAWLQDKWPDEIYAAWVDINERAKQASQ